MRSEAAKGNAMIARMWRGHIQAAKKCAYVRYLKETGLADYRRTAGNRGAYLLCRDEGGHVEIITLTFWDSVESIKAFAGEDYARARYYPRDAEFLLRFAETSDHFEVAEARPDGS